MKNYYAITIIPLILAYPVYSWLSPSESLEQKQMRLIEEQNTIIRETNNTKLERYRIELIECISTASGEILSELDACKKRPKPVLQELVGTITGTASGAIVPPPERQEVKQEQNVTKADTFWQAYEIAIPLIQKYEGLSLKAYPDPVRCTIGWGTVANHCGESITQHEADMRLAGIVKQVTKRVQDDFPNLTPRQQAGLISFAFNCESGYRDVAKRGLDKHKYWCNTANGKKLQGLVNRRNEERQYIFE